MYNNTDTGIQECKYIGTLGDDIKGWVKGSQRPGSEIGKSADGCCQFYLGTAAVTGSNSNLSDEIRVWAKNHLWYEVTAETNQCKLEQRFGGAIETIAGQLDYHNQPKLRRGLLDCWDHLMAKCMKIDAISRIGCRNEAERMELEFLRSKAIGAAHELAEVLELLPGIKECRNIGMQGRTQEHKEPKTHDQWVSVTEAAQIAGVHKGTISRWIRNGNVQDNGKTGRHRRIMKTDVLLQKQVREDSALQSDLRELRDDARRIM